MTAWCLALTVVAAAAEATDKPRLFVVELTAQGVGPEQARALTDAVVASLADRDLFELIATKDLETLLGAERQKQLLGLCEGDAAACSASAAQAVTARFVLSGQLSRLGATYQLSLQMVDTQKGQPVARALRLSEDLDKLRAMVPYAAAEATGTPLPPPPSKALPLVLAVGGGAVVIAGAVIGLLALSRQTVVNEELCPDGASGFTRCTGVSLRPRDFYLQQDAAIGLQKTVSLVLLAAGAALAVTGVLLWPSSTQAPRFSLLVSPGGLSVAGAF